MARRRSPKSLRRVWPLVASLIVTFAVTLVVGLAMTDTVVRWVFVRRLQSDNPDLRRQGQVYVCRHAGTDPELRRTMADLLLATDDDALQGAIVESLRCAGVWGPDMGEAWLEQLGRAVDAPEVGPRASVALALARAAMADHPVVDRPSVRVIVEDLVHDREALVRLLALRAAAAIGSSELTAESVRWLLKDESPEVRYHAAILSGVLARSGSGEPPRDLQEIDLGGVPLEPPAAFCAWLWAEEAMAPDRVVVPYKQLDAWSVLPAGLDFWPYAVAAKPGVNWDRWLDRAGRAGKDDPHRMGYWRAMLAAPPGSATTAMLLENVGRLGDQGGDSDAYIAAAVSRVAEHLPAPVWSGDPARFWRELAHFESLPPASTEITLTDQMPGLVRVAAVRASKATDPFDVLAMFDTDEPSVRRLAVLTAFDRLSSSEADKLIDRLLHTFDDSHRMAGALLAGLLGRADAIDRRLEREQAWVVQQYLKLGKMMAEPASQMAVDPVGLIARSDVDELDVVWALLHAGDRRGLDHLLDPLTGSSERLRSQLDQERFWPILKRYLPVGPQARFWMWADPALQRFQCDVLRTWYLAQARQMHFRPGTGQVGAVSDQHASSAATGSPASRDTLEQDP